MDDRLVDEDVTVGSDRSEVEFGILADRDAGIVPPERERQIAPNHTAGVDDRRGAEEERCGKTHAASGAAQGARRPLEVGLLLLENLRVFAEWDDEADGHARLGMMVE